MLTEPRYRIYEGHSRRIGYAIFLASCRWDLLGYFEIYAIIFLSFNDLDFILIDSRYLKVDCMVWILIWGRIGRFYAGIYVLSSALGRVLRHFTGSFLLLFLFKVCKDSAHFQVPLQHVFDSSLFLGSLGVVILLLSHPIDLHRFLSHWRLNSCVVASINRIFDFVVFKLRASFCINVDVDLVHEEFTIFFVLIPVGIRVILVFSQNAVDCILRSSATADALGIRKMWLLTLSDPLTASFSSFLRIQVLEMFPAVGVEVSHILLVSVIKTCFRNLLFNFCFHVIVRLLWLILNRPLLLIVIQIDHVLVGQLLIPYVLQDNIGRPGH